MQSLFMKKFVSPLLTGLLVVSRRRRVTVLLTQRSIRKRVEW